MIWDTPKTEKGWRKMNGHYHRSAKGGGEWEFVDLPEQWLSLIHILRASTFERILAPVVVKPEIVSNRAST